MTSDPVTQQVHFEDLGSTGLGNDLGSSPDNTDIMIDPNSPSHLITITARASEPANGTLTIERLTRQLRDSNCDSTTTVSTLDVPSEILSTRQNSMNLSSFVNETRSYLFMRSVNNNTEDTDPANRCVLNQGCLIDTNSLFLAYDKAANTVVRVDLGTLANGDYRLKSAISSSTSDKVYLILNKAPANHTVYAELTKEGVRNIIQLPAGINLQSIIVSGS